MAINPFTFITAINKTKENLFETQGYRDSDYIGFIVNRSFSNFADTIFIANECNYRLNQAPPKAQFQFYLNIVPAKNRYKKFFKSNRDERILTLMKHYNMSREKASSVINLFTEEELDNMEKMDNNKGGRARQGQTPE